jgi:hypothetical protein
MLGDLKKFLTRIRFEYGQEEFNVLADTASPLDSSLTNQP